MEIKTTVKWSSATRISAAGSKLCSASVCMSALCVNEMCYCVCLSSCARVCTVHTHQLSTIHCAFMSDSCLYTRVAMTQLDWDGTGLLTVSSSLCGRAGREESITLQRMWAEGSNWEGCIWWNLLLNSLWRSSIQGSAYLKTSRHQKIASVSLMVQNHTRWCRLLPWAENEPDWKSLSLRTCWKKG